MASMLSGSYERYQYGRAGQRLSKTCHQHIHQTTRYLTGMEILNTRPNHRLNYKGVTLVFGSTRIVRRTKNNREEDAITWISYAVTDRHNNCVIELDQHARLFTRVQYYPYGGIALWSSLHQSKAPGHILRYAGKERDSTGLINYGFRYYACWLMRWLNADPIGARDGLNQFRMVHNNPVSFFDHNGTITTTERTRAISMAGAKEFIGATLGGTVTYGVRAFLTFAMAGQAKDSAANIALTTVAASLSGGSQAWLGAGIGGSATGHRSAAIGGGIAGFSLGAGLDIAGYFASDEVNAMAIAHISGLCGNYVREVTNQLLAGWGPNIHFKTGQRTRDTLAGMAIAAAVDTALSPLPSVVDKVTGNAGPRVLKEVTKTLSRTLYRSYTDGARYSHTPYAPPARNVAHGAAMGRASIASISFPLTIDNPALQHLEQSLISSVLLEGRVQVVQNIKNYNSRHQMNVTSMDRNVSSDISSDPLRRISITQLTNGTVTTMTPYGTSYITRI